MSSLIFYIDQDQAAVFTDTLATESDGSPLLFTSKAQHIPHLAMIVAGTGIGQFAAEWALHINCRMAVAGIESLDGHTPRSLRKLWDEYKSRYSLPAELSTTVYHFGLSEPINHMVGFAYRSERQFSSERIPSGTGVKPFCNIPAGNLFDNIRVMMEEQRDRESNHHAESRVHIGGACVSMYLTREGCMTREMFRFSDYSSHLQNVLRKATAGS